MTVRLTFARCGRASCCAIRGLLALEVRTNLPLALQFYTIHYNFKPPKPCSNNMPKSATSTHTRKPVKYMAYAKHWCSMHVTSYVHCAEHGRACVLATLRTLTTF